MGRADGDHGALKCYEESAGFGAKEGIWNLAGEYGHSNGVGDKNLYHRRNLDRSTS